MPGFLNRLPLGIQQMPNNTANNTRIAKNTFALVVRMLFMMGIALFTSRVVLESLGEDNYGIYNVVGGVVAMFSILSSPLSSAIQRFLTFELGTGNKDKLCKIFSTSVNIQLVIALIVVILCEIIGVWFVNHKMTIPVERLGAANFVLQCSVATFVVNLISVPYNATIIAHERMDVFAYLSILDSALRLTVAYLIYISTADRLKVYALLLLAIAVLMRLIYGIYCSRHFDEAHYKMKLDKALFREMSGFAGWNFFGNTAYMFNTQGVNMLINVFFGVKLNAARAIAVQVDAAISQFVNSFTTAINPQITKSYASNNRAYLYSLINRGSKFSFMVMYLIIVPVVLEADTILGIWLKDVPQQTAIFTRLVVFGSLSTTMGTSMLTGILATGDIRRYQIVVTMVGCMVFPLTWIAYALGAPAYTTYIIYAVIYFSLNAIRLAALKRLMEFPVKTYVNQVLPRMLFLSVAAFVAPGVLVLSMPPSFLRLLVVCAVSALWGLVCGYFIGLDRHERMYFQSKAMVMVKRIIKKNKHNELQATN